MKNFLALASLSVGIVALSACGDDKKTATPEPTPTANGTTGGNSTLTYANTFKTIIDRDCKACHPSTSASNYGFNATTLDGVKAKADRMIARIEDGTMPQGNPSYKTSADGKKLLDWLKSGNLQ